MSTPRELLAAIERLPLAATVRVMCLSGDQERTIALSGIRRILPGNIRLLSGPGCAASICPQADLYQAIQLASRYPITLLTTASMLRLPVNRHLPGPHTLAEAGRLGADVRTVSAPVEALLTAAAEPRRRMVLFLAGFETLLAPLAGMILEGLPNNLRLLICGRRVDPLLDGLLVRGQRAFDALLLPGNRCAVTGTMAWERMARHHRIPAAVSGYTISNILTALHGVLRQLCAGEAQVDNRYQLLVRAEGNAMARDRMDRVFEQADGNWRGVGNVQSSAFRLRHTYRVFDADRHYPDLRGDCAQQATEMPAGCECADVVLGRKEPTDCDQFAAGCQSWSPYGPCMASLEGTCNLRSGHRRLA